MKHIDIPIVTAGALSVIAVMAVAATGADLWVIAPMLAAIAAWAWAWRRAVTSEVAPALQGRVTRTVDAASGDLRLLRDNLNQVRMLVQDATETIGRDFDEINLLARRHHQILLRTGAYDLDHAATAEITAINGEIERRIESLVVSIQFGDIVSQLLEFTDRQAVEVEDYLDSLSGIAEHDEMPSDRKDGDRVAMHPAPGMRRQPLRLSDGRKPTAQKSMQAGEIELF